MEPVAAKPQVAAHKHQAVVKRQAAAKHHLVVKRQAAKPQVAAKRQAVVRQPYRCLSESNSP